MAVRIHYIVIIISIIIPGIYSICDHYYQSSGSSSIKRPFDICYKSLIDNNLKKTSYRYCIESTQEEYGNNSVNGHTAFRQDFNDIDCKGNANTTRIVNEPYHILCNNNNPTCEILRFRQYPIINASICTYNQSIYVEDIQDEGQTSEAIFCNAKSDNGEGSYFWGNTYYNGQCENDRLFEATYQFDGCQGDGSTYVEILGCDSDAYATSTSHSNTEVSDSGCSNYWQSNDDGSSSSRRPFDVCYRSYHDQYYGDYSYRYICNNSVINKNYTIGGYTVFKQFFNDVGCNGQPNATILEDTVPYAIYCGGDDCDIVGYRVYDLRNVTYDIGRCNDINFPNSIVELNDYQENIHVIERCDDDGFVSDSYFCGDNYFSINSYNNDKCHNKGIYAAKYYFEGCYDNYQYIQIVNCDNPFTAAAATTDIPTMNPLSKATLIPTSTITNISNTIISIPVKNNVGNSNNMLTYILVGGCVVIGTIIIITVMYYIYKRNRSRKVIHGVIREIVDDEKMDKNTEMTLQESLNKPNKKETSKSYIKLEQETNK